MTVVQIMAHNVWPNIGNRWNWDKAYRLFLESDPENTIHTHWMRKMCHDTHNAFFPRGMFNIETTFPQWKEPPVFRDETTHRAFRGVDKIAILTVLAWKGKIDYKFNLLELDPANPGLDLDSPGNDLPEVTKMVINATTHQMCDQ